MNLIKIPLVQAARFLSYKLVQVHEQILYKMEFGVSQHIEAVKFKQECGITEVSFKSP